MLRARRDAASVHSSRLYFSLMSAVKYLFSTFLCNLYFSPVPFSTTSFFPERAFYYKDILKHAHTFLSKYYILISENKVESSELMLSL